MKRCPMCGKWGWFLILYYGLCEDCLDSVKSSAMQGKIFIDNRLANRYNNVKDLFIIEAINELEKKIKEKIIPTAIASNPEEAKVIFILSDGFNYAGRYSDGSIAGRVDIKLQIKDRKENLLFSETFEGTPPADKIYRRPNELASTVTGCKFQFNYIPLFQLRSTSLHKSI
jgi:hypothetical protein